MRLFILLIYNILLPLHSKSYYLLPRDSILFYEELFVVARVFHTILA